ncbi:MAG: multidrug transporter [Clostridiales bacterium]|nr:multidrug transporter [Clostridiales bacterium]
MIDIDYEFLESDWKLFREKLPGWQEAYMDKLNREYMDVLANENLHASEKFWKLEEQINKDKYDAGVSVHMSRSRMISNILALLEEGVITIDNLDDFSDGLKERMGYIVQRWE